MGFFGGQGVSIGMGSVDVVMGGLAHLVRSLMVTRMGSLIVVCVRSANLAHSAVFSKQGVVFNCLEAEMSCSDAGSGDRISRVLANRPD